MAKCAKIFPGDKARVTQKSPTETNPTTPKWLTCNGQQFCKLVGASLAWLQKNQQHVNSLNVFPVPDGDTGTNMLLTMRSAYSRVRGDKDTHVGRVAREVSQGALMGARGNSGVILSQIWRGLANGLEGKESFTADDLAKALKLASDTAYSGVMKPVEGTLLTVIRESAQETADAARKSKDLRFVLERTLERSQQSLERTPELLPVLKQAGVVDAGGQGLVYLFEGMLRYVRGESVGPSDQPEKAAQSAGNNGPAQAKVAPKEGLENPYDVQFILQGKKLNLLEVREKIDAMGDSTVVVGDESVIKVHVHVKDPGVPISYGISLGQIADVVVENMQMQMEEIIHEGAALAAVPPLLEPEVQIEPGQVAVVTVVPGAGLARVFRSMGVAGIINGGQTNNPSTEEIFQALQAVPTDKVIILPNNKNIILAAESARDLSPKQVVVIPTRTIPQGISALIAYQRENNLEEMVANMLAAANDVASGEITTATRTVTLDGVEVNQGNIIALANGHLCAAGENWEAVLPALLNAMNAGECELISIFYGADVSASQAQSFASQIEALYPNVEIELVEGGQAHYHFILGAE